MLADDEFLTQKVQRVVGAMAQHIADGEELRFIVFDDTAVRRDAHLAVGEGIEGVDGFV